MRRTTWRPRWRSLPLADLQCHVRVDIHLDAPEDVQRDNVLCLGRHPSFHVGKSWEELGKEKSLLSKNRKSWEVPKGQDVYNKWFYQKGIEPEYRKNRSGKMVTGSVPSRLVARFVVCKPQGKKEDASRSAHMQKSKRYESGIRTLSPGQAIISSPSP